MSFFVEMISPNRTFNDTVGFVVQKNASENALFGFEVLRGSSGLHTFYCTLRKAKSGLNVRMVVTVGKMGVL